MGELVTGIGPGQSAMQPATPARRPPAAPYAPYAPEPAHDPGPCPNEPPCDHSADFHDSWNDDDARLVCGVGGCGCGNPDPDWDKPMCRYSPRARVSCSFTEGHDGPHGGWNWEI